MCDILLKVKEDKLLAKNEHPIWYNLLITGVFNKDNQDLIVSRQFLQQQKRRLSAGDFRQTIRFALFLNDLDTVSKKAAN